MGIPPGGSIHGPYTSLPNPQGAHYPSLQEFMSFSLKDKDYSPANTNLFSLHLATPRLLGNFSASNWDQDGTLGYDDATFIPELGKLQKCLNFYCQTVSLPSKQLTTAALVNVGTPTKYATGTAFSQVSTTFIMPRSQHTRNFFERWTMLMAPDSNQYTDYYDLCISPRMIIYKWERGGGRDVNLENQNSQYQRKIPGKPDQTWEYPFNKGDDDWGSVGKELRAYRYKLTAAWELRNVFPYNIGSIQLNNSAARSMTLTVGFFFERYRFFAEQDFDSPGKRKGIAMPMDNYVDPITDAQKVWAAVEATHDNWY